MKTTDGGANWFQQFFLDNRNYLGTSSIGVTKNITSGQTRNFSPDTGKLVQTSNGGSTWTERTIADSIRYIGKFHFIDSLRGWVGARGPRGTYLLRTTDGGGGWQIHGSPGIYLVSFLDTLHGWGTTGSFEIYRTQNGGVTWQYLYNGFPEDVGVYAILLLDSLNGRIFGGTFYRGRSADVIMRTTNGGVSWYQESIGLSSGSFGDITDAVMLDATHGWAVCRDGSVLRYQVITSVVERLPELPTGFSLRQNYPNPFNPTTTIEYEITTREQVRLKVYDELGKEVRTVVNELQEPGVYRVLYSVDASLQIASGQYYYTLTAGEYKQTRRMILLK